LRPSISAQSASFDACVVGICEGEPHDALLQEILEVTEVVGVVKVGLSPKAISALPVLTYSAARRKLLLPADDTGPCTSGAAVDLEKSMVCLEEYEDDVDVTCLPCRHLYHPPCIEQWLMKKKVRRRKLRLCRGKG
jgi:hypothetical protein